MFENLDGLAQQLGEQSLRPKQVKPPDLRQFLQTPQGQAASRAAVESIIRTQSMGPLPIPTYKVLLKTLQAQMGSDQV